MTKRLTVACLAVLLSSFILIAAFPMSGAVAPTLRIYVDPSDIENVTFVPNTIFNVSVKVDNMPANPGVMGVQFILAWNASILNGVSMKEVLFAESTPAGEEDNIWRLSHKVYQSNVSYAYAYQDTQRAIDGGYAPLNGSHTVAIVTLKVVGMGACPIYFATSIIGDPSARDIPHQATDGFFSNLPPAPPPKAALLYVDPAKIVDPSLTPSHNFTISINIINASTLQGVEFKLGFNASVLQASSVTSGGFFPNSVTPITQIDNTAGFIVFNASLSTPLSGDGNVTIVQFHVEADKVRNSTIHLYDLKLFNSTGQALSFNTVDGSFTNAPTLVGDINEDGIVDIRDALLAAYAFGTSRGHPNWNPNVDLDNNGKINIIDMILLAANFGRKS